VGLVPHYGWTCLGGIVAASLVIPTLLPARHLARQPGSPAEANPS